MERPIERCINCGSTIVTTAYGTRVCPLLGCSVLETGEGNLRNIVFKYPTTYIKKPKKGPPLTIDDILDVRQWSSQVKSNELSNFERVKTKA